MPLDLGSLTCKQSVRPFVSDLQPDRTGLFPLPVALTCRSRAGRSEVSALSQRLLHALLYLGWNGLEFATNSPPMGYECKTLRRLIGRANQSSNSDLLHAFSQLQSIEWHLPLRSDPTRTTTTTLLQWTRYDAGTNAYFWRFADDVVDWCRAGGAVYSWLDIKITSKLKSLSSIRLYEVGSVLVGRDHKSIRLKTSELRVFLDAHEEYQCDADFKGKLVTRSMRAVTNFAPFTMRAAPVRFANIGLKIELDVTVQPKDDWRRDDALDVKPLTPAELAWCEEVFPALL